MTHLSIGHLCPLAVCLVRWHLNEVGFQIFSQQSTRDSKRRSSKEASALSKDGQPVSANSSDDPEPENASDERWTSTRRKTAVGASASPENKMEIWRRAWLILFIYFYFLFFCKILAVVCSDLRHKHLQTSPSKNLWMLHLRCAIANACAKKRVGSEQCSHFTPCFSPMLMVPVRECVTVFSQCEEKKQNKKEEKKKEQIVPYAHDNYKQCVLCEAFLRICFSSLCKYTPFVVNDYQ